jgi:uncharacterized protein
MKLLLKALKITIVGYVVICILLYFFQEKLIFFPEKLPKTYKFNFGDECKEINIITKDQKSLSGLLFKSGNSRGLIFYLHGNAGSLNSWGQVAKTYTNLHYDVFILDYRGYGKSEGSINGQQQLFDDVQSAYDLLKNNYPENRIVVLGYSVGTGLAAKIAATNNPRLLILQAPYYSMSDMMRHAYPVIPTFILKYKLRTNEFIEDCKMPVVIFHGNQDEVIYYGSSLKLKEEFKNGDTLITLRGQGHNGMTDNPDYVLEIDKVLSR